MLVRRAEPADLAAVAETLRQAFAPFEPLYTPAGFTATTPGPEQLRARWGEGPMWVAEREGLIVGTVSAVPRPGELYVRSMAVRPEAQGLGAGAELLHTVEHFGRDAGEQRLSLTTTPFLAAAIRLYQRHGFVAIGEADLFGTPLLVMAKEIAGPPASGR
jgi:ribosomal protein S18 acetylase RimI-like enzyme